MSESQETKTMTVECPICGETFGLRDGVRLLHRIVRCTECSTHLQVTTDWPIVLKVFRSHGLAFQSGQVRDLWSPATTRRRL